VVGGTAPYEYSLDGTSFQSTTSFSGLSAGLYTLHVRDANGCTYNEDITVGGVGPQITEQQITEIDCFGANNASIELTANSVSGTLSYSIDNGITFQNNGRFVGLSPGTYSILVQDNNGCVAVASNINIAEPELLQGDAQVNRAPDPGIANGSISVVGLAGGVPPYQSTLNGDNMGSNTTFENLGIGAHNIIITDQNNCSISFDFEFEGEFPAIEIPNGFTPNGDGMNDIWELAELNTIYPDADIKVFNRWGQMVFNSTGYVTPWNGLSQGKELPTATYYYVINLHADIEPLQGTVTIIR
jgi:gliding motility-associated-like protein